MRTLKKVLALTVVLATMFSLTAFAAFTDADQINESCQDDINLMNALNVMVGDAEGTFRPNGTISRAEAAKMVYVVRNGGVDDKASGWTGMKVFTDVPAGAWYEGYVNYCASLGIIAGVGGNKFNPDGAVTGVELAKMLLVVAGYKPDVQGYTGANWSLNVINDAQQAYMFEGYALAFSASAPRQWAAKLFSNAILKTQTAVYFNGELVNGLSAFGRAVTVGEKYFNLETKTGILETTMYASLNGGLASRKVSTIKNENGTFTYNVPASLLGQEVTVVYKESKDTPDVLDAKDTVYDVYATGKTNMITVTRDAGVVDGTTLKLAGVNGGKAMDYSTVTNQITMLTDGGLTSKKLAKTESGLKELFNASNENVTLILNDKDEIQYAFVENVYYAFIDKINLEKGQFSLKGTGDKKVISLNDENGKTLTFGNTDAGKEKLADYVVVPTGLEAGNLVKYTASIETGKLVYTFEGMTPDVSGAMTVRATDGTSATVAGNEYKLGAAAAALGFAKIPDITADDTFNVFTDGKYAVYVTNDSGATANAVSKNVAYIINKTKDGEQDIWGNAVKQVQVLLADGTNKVYDYAAQPTSEPAKSAYIAFDDAKVAKGNVLEYVLSGEKIYFRSWSYTPADGSVSYGQAIADPFTVKNQRFGAFPVDGNSYFFYANDGEYKVVKAADLLDDAKLTGATTATVKVGGIPTVAFGVVTGLGSTKGDAVYAFVTGVKTETIADGKKVDAVNITLSTGEEVKNAVIKEGGEFVEQGAILKVTPVDSQYKFEEADLTEGAIYAFSTAAKTAMINVTKNGANVKDEVKGNTANFALTDDTQIFYVAQDKDPKVADKLTDAFDITYQNVKVSVDRNGNVLAIYILSGTGDGELEQPDMVISSISVNTVVPDEVEGETRKLSDLTVNVTAAGASVTSTKWNDGSSDIDTSLAETNYDGTKAYTIEVVLTPDKGYKFAAAAKIAKAATGLVKEEGIAVATGAVEGTVKVTVTLPKEPTKITKVALTGDAPANGEAFDPITAGTMDPATSAKLADTDAVTWKTEDGKAVGEKAIGGNTYKVTIKLVANDASTKYVFDKAALEAEGCKAVALGTGFTNKAISVSADKKTLTITADAAVEEEAVGAPTLSALNAPSASTAKVADTVLTASADAGKYDIETAWAKEDGTAIEGEAFGAGVFKITVTIKPAKGYKWADTVKASDITISNVLKGFAADPAAKVEFKEGAFILTATTNTIS